MINKLKNYNHILILMFCVGLFVNTSHAQKRRFKSGKVNATNYFTELSFDFERNKIVIPVEIKGKTFRFLLDTGAPNIISKEVYEMLQPDKSAVLTASDANAISQEIKITSVESIKLGALEFKGFSALVFDLNASEIFKCFNIDGFIGSHMLRHSIIQIDAAQKVLKLTDNQKRLHLDKSQSQKIKFADNQYGPYIWIDVHGKDKGREMVLIDTGMGDLYDISKSNFNIFKSNQIFNDIGNSDGASSVSLFGDVPVSNHTRVHLPKLIINGFQINNVITHTSNGDKSKVGAELLNYGVMTIDYKNRRFYFDSYQDSLDLDVDFGFEPTLKNNKLIVGFVWDKDLKTKISYGDEILEVNNEDVSLAYLCKYIAQQSVLKTSDALVLKIKTADGNIIDLEVKKKPLSLILENIN